MRVEHDSSGVQELAELSGWLAEGDLTCLVCDAQGRTGALGAAFRPVWEGARCVGRAITARTFGTDLSAVFGALEAAERGSVLVIDSHGVVNSAFWGERTTRAALARGVAGVVIDGACRDVTAVRRLGFPAFSTGVTPNAGLSGPHGAVNVPVQAGGVPVRPGDLVVADENGVVIVPAEDIHDIVVRVRAARDEERRVLALADDGENVAPASTSTFERTSST